MRKVTLNKIETKWVSSQEELEEAQRLRYKIFAHELSANIHNPDEIDQDQFDDVCMHLISVDCETNRVVGTYRVMTPEMASQIGQFYTDSEFDLSNFNNIRPYIIELGRSCVHKDYRNGVVILQMWAKIGEFMKDKPYHYVLGCASVSVADGGQMAADLFRYLSDNNYLLPSEEQITPKLPFQWQSYPESNMDIQIPPLIKGYLRFGGKVCGHPALDPVFNTVDLPILLNFSNINPRYAKHFLGV